jgi:predicted TIM-barrel enzyme
MDDVIDHAVVQARDLAAAAYERLMLESTDDRPYFPANEDSLIVPRAAEGQ